MDDNRIVADTLDDFLSSLGHSAPSFGTVGELIDELGKTPPADCIILADPRLENMSRHAELRGVHERFPDLPVIAITGSGWVPPAQKSIKC